MNGDRRSQATRTNGDGNGRREPNCRRQFLAPGVPSTARGSPGTPKRALLPPKALAGRPLGQAEPDVPNSATGIWAPYAAAPGPPVDVFAFSAAGGTVGLVAPLPCLGHPRSHLDLQPLSSRRADPTGEHKQGRFQENAIVYSVAEGSTGTGRPRARWQSAEAGWARCTNPPRAPWQRSNGLVGAKKNKKLKISCLKKNVEKKILFLYGEGRTNLPFGSAQLRRLRKGPC